MRVSTPETQIKPNVRFNTLCETSDAEGALGGLLACMGSTSTMLCSTIRKMLSNVKSGLAGRVPCI